MKEEFRKIKGFVGYEVSNFGSVKSYKRNPDGALMRISMDGRVFMKDSIGFMKNRYVRNLVAIAFLKYNPKSKKPVINHDGDILNNRLDNVIVLNPKHKKRKKKGALRGISYISKQHKWKATISINGAKPAIIGLYDSREQAIAARKHQIDISTRRGDTCRF